MRSSLLSALALTAVACATTQSAAPAPSEAPATQPLKAGSVEALPFIHDDYPGAVAQARAKGVPLFVDVWAPW